MTQLWSVTLVAIVCVASAYAGILLKQAADTLRFRFKSMVKNKYLIGGVLIYGFATVAYIIALKAGELSILYPVVSTTYIWIALFSQRLLNEKMNKHKWLGILLILIGVSLIGVGS